MNILPITDVLRALGRPFTYYPVFAHAFDDCEPVAVWLSLFLSWEGQQSNSQGWIYKTGKEITRETGMGRYSQETARKKLTAAGAMQEDLRGVPAKLHYKFDWTRVNEIVSAYIDTNQAKSTSAKPAKSPKQDPLIYRLRTAFDTYFKEYKDGLEYEWSSENNGKDWANLKKLREYFRTRLEAKARHRAGYEAKVAGRELPANYKPAITDEEVFLAFDAMLKNLPEYHQRINLTPAKLFSEINVIMPEILENLRKPSNGNGTKNAIERRELAATDYGDE